MTEIQESIRGAIATRLREARKVAGLSQGQVAKLLAMHRPTISEIEAGNRRVSAEEVTKHQKQPHPHFASIELLFRVIEMMR